jgi:ABC-type glycerol-3-phosphate transport system substrate-binding protein
MNTFLTNKAWKKGLMLTLMLTLVFALAACGSSETTETTTEDTEQTNSNESKETSAKLVGNWTGANADGKALTAEFKEGNKVAIDGTDYFYYVYDTIVIIADVEITDANKDSVMTKYTASFNSDTELSLQDDEYQTYTLTKQ